MTEHRVIRRWRDDLSAYLFAEANDVSARFLFAPKSVLSPNLDGF